MDASSNEPDPVKPDKPRRKPVRYVWQRIWFQWVLGTLVVFLFLSFVLPPVFMLLSKVSGILSPVLVGLGLAYIFNPLVTWGERKYGLPRPVSAGLILGIAGLTLLITLAALIPIAYGQGVELSRSAPTYAETVLGWMGSDVEQAKAKAEQALRSFDWTTLDPAAVRKTLGVGAGVIFAGLGLISYLGVATLVACFCFFVFVWRWGEFCRWFIPYIPVNYREQTLGVIGEMDKTVSAIIRGRLIQSLVVTLVLSIGWWAVGVPYWLLLGVLGGVLNLLPYAAVLSWPIAVLMAVLGAFDEGNGMLLSLFDEGQSVLWACVLPSVVYFIAQALDGWVVEPMVQGKATGMDALTVLLVVLMGGSLLGVLGMLLAIPIAACIKIVAVELVLPKLRAFAAKPPDLNAKGDGV